ncbi:hypothetical protein D081_0256 [Anaerovibrio sp. JC8]|uniref:polysialyltransferase family glycosyltransferase n=1 Tax=Anaerovibrio sp. JC8 TaxID=1240085 RepID=UPI000A0C488C|nr:polysialyltransferase family glycosyltransferase [Anaerovibrio sp. JC8]ORU01437.1 hypothetical protein D081_0256 [Anaerovibrio sp. JC8]
MEDCLSKISRYKYVNAFFFSSGDNAIVPPIIQMFPEAIVNCVGEGSVSYAIEIKRQKTNFIKKYIKNTLYSVISYLYGFPLNDSYYKIHGDESVNVFIDARPEKANALFGSKRILIKYNWDDIKKEIGEIVKVEKIILPQDINGKKTAILLTEPLSEGGFVLERDEIDFYQNIIHRLQSRGYTVYIKPHPRESSNKRNLLHMDDCLLNDLSGLPIEALFSLLNIEILIGLGTSALWNAYDMEIAQKYVAVEKIYEEQSTGKKIVFNGGTIKEKSNVIHPHSWKEFEDCL